MCGIAGIVGLLNGPNRQALRRMSDAVAHRGPDGQGQWEAEPDARGWGPMLAHRRLAILDVSEAAAQPMIDPANGNVISFNGEIYNYTELAATLAIHGRRLESTGDTAALLATMGLRGRAGVRELRGMFAFAFWDARQRQLMLARDPLGIKPLYVVSNPDPEGDWSLAFASEVRALLASGLIAAPRLNPLAVASVVWNGFTVAPESMVAGIESMAPGESRVFDAQGRTSDRDRFWSLPAPQGLSDEASVAEALEESVRLHLAADVPLAVFLSGGIDSSAIANLAQKHSRAPVHSFTLTFDEADFSEGLYAQRIAHAIGTEHHEYRLTEQAFMDRLDAALDSLDQPSFDGLNSYFMAHAVRDAGFKVALVGSGGDELFGGYRSFRDLPRLLDAARWSRWVPRETLAGIADWCADRVRASDGSMPPQARWAKLPRMLRHSHDLVALYQTAYALFLPSFQDELLGDQRAGRLSHGLPPDRSEEVRREARGRTALSSIAVMEQRLFLGERLLRDTDAVSMSASVEIRLPLVDQRVVEQVSRLPDGPRFAPPQSKAMLRRIGLRGLDPQLFARPKAGFELPYARWLRGRLGKTIDATLRDADAVRATGLNPKAVLRLWQGFQEGRPGLYWSRVWALYVLIRWCQRHSAHI